MPILYRDVLTRIRPTETTDPWSDKPILDYEHPEEPVGIPGAVVAPRSQEEVLYAQEIDARYLAQCGPKADWKPTDRVLWQGDQYNVKGGIDKLVYRGKTVALQFGLQRVTGG